MEVTDLKELKKLMKGDVMPKFEFEEENDPDEYEKNISFSYGGQASKIMAKGHSGATYKNQTYQQSHQEYYREKYRDLSSDDSELLEQQQEEEAK